MSTHKYVFACECGASIGFSPGVTDKCEESDMQAIRMWEIVHSGEGHERVTPTKARQVRDAANRRHRGRDWNKQNPKRRAQIDKAYRLRKKATNAERNA